MIGVELVVVGVVGVVVGVVGAVVGVVGANVLSTHIIYVQVMRCDDVRQTNGARACVCERERRTKRRTFAIFRVKWARAARKTKTRNCAFGSI